MIPETNQTQEQNSYEDQFASSSSKEGAVTLPTSINDHEFQLVYQAKEESVGGTKLRMARNIVDFAKSYRCRYVLLIDGSCWVSPDKGISVLAQIEGNEKLDNFDYVVLPLDHAVYIAKINDGIVVEEKVRPIDQAISYLQNHKHAEIAILAGGHAYEDLASHQFIVNCDLTLFTWESESADYRFKAINLVLITHQLFHKRLFTPVLIVIIPLLTLAFLFSPLYDVKLEKSQKNSSNSFLELEGTANSVPKVNPTPKISQIFLSNSASQLLMDITPWISGKTINFLRTCRLKSISISKKKLSYMGERMSNIKKNQLGCGNSRLEEIAKANNIKIHGQGNWSINLPLELKTAQKTKRKDYSETIERLELISLHIGWQLNILSTINNGEKQRLKVLLQGKNLNRNILHIISEGLNHHATEFIKGSIQFNPNNFDLLDAQFEIDILTQSSATL